MKMYSHHMVNSEEIYNDLLQRIINLDYMPGEGISENELCEVYGATRHAIRGALAVLKEKGLVEVFPQRGTYISLINLALIDDIMFLREAVEQATIHEIMKKEDHTELVRKLRDCLKKQIASKETVKNLVEFYKYDDDFHQILLMEINRTSVQELYSDEMLHMKRWRNIEVSENRRLGNLAEEHKGIIDAIEANEEYEARRILGIHMNSAKKFGEEMRMNYPQYFI